MAKRNTGTLPSTTSLVLAGYDAGQLQEWLDAHPNTIKDTKGVERQVQRNVSVQSIVPTDLYVAQVNYAAQAPGAVTANKAGDRDLASGVLARSVRGPLFSAYMGWDNNQWTEWEQQRQDAITAALQQRMSGVAAARGKRVEEIEQTVNQFAAMRGNNKIMAALKSEMPEIYELLATMDEDEDEA